MIDYEVHVKYNAALRNSVSENNFVRNSFWQPGIPEITTAATKTTNKQKFNNFTEIQCMSVTGI